MRTLGFCLALLIGSGCIFDSAGIDTAVPGFAARKVITLHPDIAEDLSDFPVAIVIADDAELAEGIRAGGADLYFTASDGVTPLSFEIEEFSQATGSLVAWVRVPHLSATADTHLYLYYGDPDAVDEQDIDGTWMGLFAGVWHMAGPPVGAASLVPDSARYQNHGVAAPTLAPREVDGIIGRALQYDGTRGQHVVVDNPANGSLDFGTGSFGLSLWVNVPFSMGRFDTPFAKGAVHRESTQHPGYRMVLGQGDWEVSVSAGGLVRKAGFGSEGEFLGRWVHLASIVDREAAELRTYVDGALRTTTSLQGFDSVTNSLDAFLGDSATVYNGLLDEVRVYGAVVPDAWLAAEVENAIRPAQFLTVGPEELL